MKHYRISLHLALHAIVKQGLNILYIEYIVYSIVVEFACRMQITCVICITMNECV